MRPVIEVSHADFEALVAEALDSIPPELGRLMSNVAVLVEDDPPPGEDLLGVYEGIPLTERDGWYSGVLPDTITIFRNPILRLCDAPEDVVDEVRVTVVHEVAHHFGIDDDTLHDLGWG
jgi:predicted Zn-dependent protease with MMP-like domain